MVSIVVEKKGTCEIATLLKSMLLESSSSEKVAATVDNFSPEKVEKAEYVFSEKWAFSKM